MEAETDTCRSPEETRNYPQSRTVSRLDRKRATDRRAQRAARERRQNYIDSLLRQIETLSGLPHDQVHELFQSNERLRAENEMFRARLAGLLGDGSGHDWSASSAGNVGSVGTPDSSALQTSLLQHHAHDHRESQATTCSSPGSLHGPQDPRGPGTALVVRPSSPIVISQQLELFRCLPENLPPSNLADRILSDFVREARSNPATPALCATCPDIWLLCQPRPPQQRRCLTVVLLDVLSTYPDIVSLTELVASFILMFWLQRWQCEPTRENYNCIPECLRPTPVQLRLPHPSWMDRIPYPGIRSYLVGQQDDFDFEEFAIYYRAAITISWPYSNADVLISCPSDSCRNKLRINPVFEHHVSNLAVWNLKDSFVEHFPVFKDVLNR